MSRSQRLLDLIQILRRHRYPVAGTTLADALGISLRTLYRDIATLQEHGATIEGEAGVGYVLRPGFLLPPLMFSEEEIEAIALGTQWVMKRTDHDLSKAAKDALVKIGAVLPSDLKEALEASGLLVGPGDVTSTDDALLGEIREAIRKEKKITITYLDLKDKKSERTLWPIALAFFDQVRILVAWCELRQDFRHFRTDRIKSLKTLEKRMPRRRPILVKEWRKSEGIPEP